MIEAVTNEATDRMVMFPAPSVVQLTPENFFFVRILQLICCASMGGTPKMGLHCCGGGGVCLSHRMHLFVLQGIP